MKNIHRAKFILIGLIIGLMASSFFAYADEIQQFILTKVNYPIIVNNQEYTNSELPVLNYEGNTYVPLKAVGKLLNAEVKWNDGLNRVEIGDCSTIIEENNVKSTTNTDLKENIVIKDSIEYISLISINDKYYKFDKGYCFEYTDSQTKFVYKERQVDDGSWIINELLEISNNVLTIINGKTCIQYNYYINNILPLIKAK